MTETKLPVLATFTHTFVTLNRSVGIFVIISLYWMVGLAIFKFKLSMNGSSEENINFFDVFISTFAFCSIAVNWHRFRLMGEEIDPLRMDKFVWRYFGCLSLIIGVILIILIGVFLFANAYYPIPNELFRFIAAFATAILIIKIFLSYMMTLVSLRLPSIATGKSDIGYKKAYDICKQHGKALMFLGWLTIFATSITEFIGGGIINSIVDLIDNDWAKLILHSVLVDSLHLYIGLFNINLWTTIYTQLVENQPLET